MNEDTEGHEAAEPAGEPHRRGSALAAIALLVAVVALAGAAWGNWRLQRVTRSQQAVHQQDLTAIAALQHQLAAANQQAEAGAQRLAGVEARLTALRSGDRGLDQRVSNLESAYASLSGGQQSGHDAILLDDAEMLLRLGQQRYELSHDAGGALKAYSQAIDALDQVQDPAYQAVRASAIAERDALAGAAPAVPRQAALDALTRLRGEAATLPLASAEPATASSSAAAPGFWSRVRRAFGGVITVQREQPSQPLAGPRFARQTLALDLAQAQEALLGFDTTTYRTALQQAADVLDAQFDGHAADVRAARAEITKLLTPAPGGTPPKLGGALAELQSLRASQPAASAPAAAASTAVPAAPGTSAPPPSGSAQP